MKLPERPKNHILETSSFKIFERWIPDLWIIRQVTERDYGIDAYIELVNAKNEVTGDLISVQLKGTEKCSFKKDKNGEISATFPGVEISTINYWNKLPMPVFLFVVDVPQNLLFFAPVKKQLRSQYKKFLNQKTISFYLKENYSSISTKGLEYFLVEYFEEKEHVRLTEHIRTLIVHWKHYLEYFHAEMGRDSFLPVEEPEVFLHIFKSLRELSRILNIKWDAAELKEIFEFDKVFKDEFYLLHALTMDKFVPDIEKMFFKIFESLRHIVTVQEADYWRKAEFLIFRKAFELNNVTYQNRMNLLY